MALVRRLCSLMLLGVLILVLAAGSLGVNAPLAWADGASGIVVVAGKIKIKPGTKADFNKIAMKCLEFSRQEPGSLSYSFYEDQTAANTILYFEEWRDQAAIDHHFQTPYFQEFMEQAGPLFDGAPEIKIYRVADTQTL